MWHCQKCTCYNLGMPKKTHKKQTNKKKRKVFLFIFSNWSHTGIFILALETLGNHLLWNKAVALPVNIHGKSEAISPFWSYFVISSITSEVAYFLLCLLPWQRYFKPYLRYLLYSYMPLRCSYVYLQIHVDCYVLLSCAASVTIRHLFEKEALLEIAKNNRCWWIINEWTMKKH